MTKYRILDKGFFRSPLLPLGELNGLLHDLEEGNGNALINNDLIMTAIKISNDEFADILQNTRLEDNLKVRHTFAKYLIRMCTNSIPFGLFSGCAIVKVDDRWELSRGNPHNDTLHSRLNFSAFLKLYQKIVVQTCVRKNSSYYLNPTLHPVSFNKSFRFIKFDSDASSRSFKPALIQLEFDEILEHFFKTFKLTDYKNILNNAVFNGQNQEAVTEYIDSLIELGFFVNDLFPSVDDPDFLETFYEKLSHHECRNDRTIQSLGTINRLLKKIKKNNFLGIRQTLDDIKFEFEENLGIKQKEFVHCDLQFRLDKNVIDGSTFGDLPIAISKYLGITSFAESAVMKTFYGEFSSRYGDAKIPLKMFMDRDIGIDLYFRDSTYSDSEDDLFKGVNLASKEAEHEGYSFPLYFSKLIPAISQKKSFNLEDLDSVPLVYESLNVGVSFSYNGEKPNSPIYVDTILHSDFSSLLGRFNYMDADFSSYFQETQQLEDSMVDPAEFEIVELCHFPGAIPGNVCLRKIFRSKRIVVNSNPEKSDLYPLDDLYLQASDGKIVLKSYDNGKKIIPKLSNAHNYLNNDSFQLYSLLALIGNQDTLGFKNDYDKVLDVFNYFPRVYYRNFIFIPESWRLDKKIIDMDQERLIQYFDENSLPRVFNVVDSSKRKILINLENTIMYSIMMNIARSSKSIVIEEHIYDRKDENSRICEIFLAFLK